MMEKTFAEFNKDFYGRFEDPKIFDCHDFSTLKIVLDSLKVNYAKYKRRENFFLINWLLFTAVAKFKSRFIWHRQHQATILMVAQKLKNLSTKKYLVGYSNRVVADKDQQLHNIHFTNIIKDLGTENCLFVGDAQSYEKQKNQFDFLKNDLIVAQLFNKYTAKDKLLHQTLKNNYEKLKSLGIFSKAELKVIRTGFELFFQQHRAWSYLFDNTHLNAAIVTVHYHKEGLIYAAKQRNIKVIELQHGLIAEEDIFYIFPEKVKSVIHNALFADYILTYGKAWRDRLLKGVEYSDAQIKVLGYYHYNTNNYTEQELKIEELAKHNKIAVITTQTYMENTFIKYVNSIKSKIPHNFIIVIKPHPAENQLLYKQAFENETNIILYTGGLDFLLSKASFNVTCYSTTVFDAMRFGIKSFAINFDKCSDYVNGLAKDNIVAVVEPENSFFDYMDKLNLINNNANYWYSDYEPNILKEVLHYNC